MPRRIWVRFGRPEEIPRWIDFANKGKDTFVDPDVFFYPATRTFVAQAEGQEPVCAVPVQTAYVIESLGINPLLDEKNAKHEVSVGLREILQNLLIQAAQNGIGEIYFMGTNEQTNAFAAKHGFDELPWRAFRLKVPTLFVEKTDESLQESSN